MPNSYTKAMKVCIKVCLALAYSFVCVTAQHTTAEPEDPGVASAQYLLQQATQPQRDGSHNTRLIALRELEDPALLPLFVGLTNSPYLTMRVHGQLGSAALSPTKRIDLTALAEIEDQRELVQLLSAGIDDGLIDNASMATLLTWDSLELPLKQAIALRLLGEGGEVNVTPFQESLDIELNDEVGPARLLQYALGALLLAEAGQDAGRPAIEQLMKITGSTADAVIGQVLDAAMRKDFASAGALAIGVAKDSRRQAPLRLIAIQTAMRLGQAEATTTWQAMFREEESSAQRIRLAMVALDAAEQVPPEFFDTLDDQGRWIQAIAQAGRAISQKQDKLVQAFHPLITIAQPLSAQWIISYCRRAEPIGGDKILQLIISDHRFSQPQQRGKMIQVAINAATTLCEVYPKHARAAFGEAMRVAPDQNDSDALALRQVILVGIARAQGDLNELANTIEPDEYNDFSSDALRLFIRARHGVALTDQEWQRVSDIVQGVGQFDVAMRLQLAWAYLKHKGQGNGSIKQALR